MFVCFNVELGPMSCFMMWLWFFKVMICVANLQDQSEVGSIDGEIQPEKGMHFFCFLLFWKSFNCYNFGTTGPTQVGVSAKCISSNEDFKLQSNRKLKMSHLWLPTDSPRLHHNTIVNLLNLFRELFKGAWSDCFRFFF